MVHGEAVQKPWQLGRRKVEPAGRLRERLHAGGQGSRYGAVEKEIGQTIIRTKFVIVIFVIKSV